MVEGAIEAMRASGRFILCTLTQAEALMIFASWHKIFYCVF